MKKILSAFTYLAVGSLLVVSCSKEVDMVPDGYGETDEAVKTPPSGPYQPDNSFKIVAYYAQGRNIDSIEERKFRMLTHINFAFLYPNEDGTLKAVEQPARLDTMLARARRHGVKVGVSLSGPEGVYGIATSNAAIRTRLVQNILAFAIKYDLDGVDMDWEYPRANLGQDVTFELFMSELSDSLHRWHKFLSAAVTPGLYAGGVKDGVNSRVIAKVDWFNLMAYDGIGWDNQQINHHSTHRMANSTLDVWLNEKGLPREKAILGVPAYGKRPDNVARTYRELLQSGADPMTDSTGTGPTAFFYTGIPEMKRKAQLAKDRANGVMIWELFQDANGEMSLIKAINEQLGRAY